MRYAIITGASSGLGQECARQLNQRSRDKEIESIDCFWLVARRQDRLDRLAKELNAPCRIFALDLEDATQRQSLIKAAEEACSAGDQLDWLVLAAGFGKKGAFAETKDQAVSMVEVNCVALTDLLAHLHPLVGEGRILLFASVAAFMPQLGFAVYAASKSYVLSLSRALHAEGPASVTAVCPNPVATEFFDRSGQVPQGIKRIGIEKAEKVVSRALTKAQKRRPVSISCLPARLIAFVSKILPVSWLLAAQKGLGIYR